jgi:hypothetical protein
MRNFAPGRNPNWRKADLTPGTNRDQAVLRAGNCNRAPDHSPNDRQKMPGARVMPIMIHLADGRPVELVLFQSFMGMALADDRSFAAVGASDERYLCSSKISEAMPEKNARAADHAEVRNGLCLG